MITRHFYRGIRLRDVRTVHDVANTDPPEVAITMDGQDYQERVRGTVGEWDDVMNGYLSLMTGTQ